MWGKQMIRTIMIGTSLSIQGLFERACADGTIIVRVGAELFRGRPVEP
jgi:hypothetical protein